jgi:mannitol/fructose-specific phosphotransferase system IIA component
MDVTPHNDNIVIVLNDMCKEAISLADAAETKAEYFRNMAENVQKNNVILEKVARESKKGFSKERLEETLSMLVDANLAAPDSIEKLAAGLEDNSDGALEIISSLVNLIQPRSTGRSFSTKPSTTKQASFRPSGRTSLYVNEKDPYGWEILIAEGA